MTNYTKSELINMDSSEISKRIKQELNQKYPNCLFSVAKESYSGGFSIKVALMKADRRIKRTLTEIPDETKNDKTGYGLKRIEEAQAESYHQLNQYQLIQPYSSLVWCNGVFLTEIGHNLLQEVVKITRQYNWDNSEPMTDYYDVNFYLDLSLGKWNKPFIDGQ